jgi:hypothetical protein
MTRKVFVLLLCGVGLLGLLAFTAGQLTAQRFPREEPPGGGAGQVGRFVLVRAVGDVVILLDTATGDLYQADLKRDVKKYSERPRVRVPAEPPAVDKATDKRADKDKAPVDKKAVDKVPDKGVEIPKKD